VRERRRVELPASKRALLFHPKGEMLAFTKHDDHMPPQVVLWDWMRGKELARLPHPCGEPRSFSPDGKLLATLDGDERIRVWDLAEVLGRCRPEK